MRKFFTFTVSALLVLSMAGCSNPGSSSAIPSDNPSSSDIVKPGEKDTKPENTKPEETKPEDTKPEETKPENKAVTPEDIEAAIAKALGDGYFCTVDVSEDELFLSNMAGIDLTQLDSYVAKISAVPSVDLDTVIVMNCKEGYADEAVSILNENYAGNISYIRQYPFNVAKVEGAKLYKIDNTVIFIMAGDCAPSDATPEDEAKLSASEYEKIDNVIKEMFGNVPENLAVIKEPENTNGSDDPGFEDIDDFDDMPMIGG